MDVLALTHLRKATVFSLVFDGRAVRPARLLAELDEDLLEPLDLLVGLFEMVLEARGAKRARLSADPANNAEEASETFTE